MSKIRDFIRTSFSSEKPIKNTSKNTMMSFNTNASSGLFTDDNKYDYSKPYINESANSRWVPFGEDNLYPYILLDMYNSSPFHSAIIDFKTKVILSGDLIIEGKTDSLEDKLKIEKLKLKFNRDFLERFTKEYLIHNRISFFVNNSKDIRTTELVGSEKVRSASDNFGKIGYFYSKDWRKRRGRNKEEFIPAYDAYNNKEALQIKVFQTLSPGQDVYAIPSYSSAGNWIWLDGQIAFFQKQNIENSINPSAIIKLYKNFANDEDERDFIDGLTSSFAGAREAGKVMVFVTDDKETAPDIEIAEPNKLDKAFAGVQTNIISNVAYSHLINPSLMGIATAGKLGATQELIDAFNIFNNVYVKPMQRVLSQYLTELARIQGIKVSIKLTNNNDFLTQ